MDKEIKTYQIDFEKNQSMAFTSPLAYRFYRKQERLVENWRELYASVLSEFARSFADSISILPKDEIGDLKQSKKMKKPVSIRRGVYVETDLNTEAIIRRIRSILDECKLPYTHLSITYLVDEERKAQYQQMRIDAANKPKVYALDWNVQATYTGSSPVSYRYKTKNTKQIASWYDIYVQLITDLMAEYPKKIKHGVSVGGRRSYDVCDAAKKHNMRRPQNIGNGLVLETFGTPAILIDRMYHFLALCKVDPSRIVIKFGFEDKQRESEYLEQLPGQTGLSSNNTNIDGKVARRCKSILRKQFENGFRLKSSIDMNRLRESYQKNYKEELPADEDVIAILHSINKPMDGRIYADRSEEQDDLIEVILQDIDETFSSGATCIYLQPILDKHQMQIHEHLKIYTIDALAELIVSTATKAYTVKRNYLCFGRRKPDADGEIIAVLQKSSTPITAADVAAQFWYIPKEKVNQVLISTDSIVNIQQEHYYYAPNLPVGRSDKARIRENLKTLLAIQDSLTEIELLNTVLQECPNLLSEVSFLSWRGFRNSLLYLFGDVIVLDGNMIKANRKA